MSGRPKPPAGKVGSVRNKDAETDADRARRRAEKQRRVGEHRQAILQKVNPQQARVKLHKKEDLICPVEFTNTLPALPLDPKLMIYPFDDDFLTAFDVTNGVSADAAVPYELHSQANLGLQINIIDPAVYEVPRDAPPLDPADAEIMSDAYAKPAAARGGAGGPAEEERLSVEWLMQSSLMHLDPFDSVYKHADVNATASLALASKKAAMDHAYRGSRADRIAASFAAVASDVVLRHPARPELEPRRMWEVIPDAARTAVSYVQVRAGGGRRCVCLSRYWVSGVCVCGCVWVWWWWWWGALVGESPTFTASWKQPWVRCPSYFLPACAS
jgi:hypothetical protein